MLRQPKSCTLLVKEQKHLCTRRGSSSFTRLSAAEAHFCLLRKRMRKCRAELAVTKLGSLALGIK